MGGAHGWGPETARDLSKATQGAAELLLCGDKGRGRAGRGAGRGRLAEARVPPLPASPIPGTPPGKGSPRVALATQSQDLQQHGSESPSPELCSGPRQPPGGTEPFPHAAAPASPGPRTPRLCPSQERCTGLCGHLHPATPTVTSHGTPGQDCEALSPQPEPCVLGVCHPRLIQRVTPGGRHFLSAPFPGDPPRQPLKPGAAPCARVAGGVGPSCSATRPRHVQARPALRMRPRGAPCAGVRKSRSAFSGLSAQAVLAAACRALCLLQVCRGFHIILWLAFV